MKLEGEREEDNQTHVVVPQRHLTHAGGSVT